MTITTTRIAIAGFVLVTALFTSPVTADGGGGQQTPPVQPGPAPAKGTCRTYDTSVTSVTVGGPVQATVEWTGSFDPWSLRFVQNITVSSNQGSRFSYVQVSTWRSAEDFIAEVDIAPPLTRSLSTTGNGAIALSKTNTYDSNGRVTGYATRSAGGTITMRYSAWDARGRPTAGAMQSPAGASSQTIAYDDRALTMTETLTTASLTSTMKYAYDRFGNMRSTVSTTNRGQGSTTTVTPHSSATVCLSDLRPVAPPAPKPAGPNPAGSFTATIGGQSWSAAIGVNATNVGSVVSVGGSDKRYIVSIGMSAKRGPGQYQAGSLADEDFTKLTSTLFAELIDRNSVVATVFDTVTKQSWQASPTIGKGTVNLTSVSGSAAGTFSLSLEPVPGTGASGSITFNGSFNVRF